MLKTIIVDDKTANIQLLKGLIREYCPQLAVTATASDLDEAYALIVQHQPDIVFLDIELTEGSGFDLIHKFTETAFEIIFVTAYSQYAVQAFREQALDYLLKPIDIDALLAAVAKAENHIRLKQAALPAAPPPSLTGKISLPTLEGYLFINHTDIIRCAASGSYTTFYLKNGEKLLTSMRLKECEELLPPAHFFRIHHSQLINLNYVSRYIRGRGGYILMEDGSTADVAVNRKADFLRVMGQKH